MRQDQDRPQGDSAGRSVLWGVFQKSYHSGYALLTCTCARLHLPQPDILSNLDFMWKLRSATVPSGSLKTVGCLPVTFTVCQVCLGSQQPKREKREHLSAGPVSSSMPSSVSITVAGEMTRCLRACAGLVKDQRSVLGTTWWLTTMSLPFQGFDALF